MSWRGFDVVDFGVWGRLEYIRFWFLEGGGGECFGSVGFGEGGFCVGWR